MGDRQDRDLRLDFDRTLKRKSLGSKMNLSGRRIGPVHERKPLKVLFNQFGDLEWAMLRRGDAAFADPKVNDVAGSRGLPLRDPAQGQRRIWSGKSSTY